MSETLRTIHSIMVDRIKGTSLYQCVAELRPVISSLETSTENHFVELPNIIPSTVFDPHLRCSSFLRAGAMQSRHIACSSSALAQALHCTSMGKDEEDADMQDLIASFSGFEENVLEQYTLAKRNLFRTAAVNYLLESGVQWGAAPAVEARSLSHFGLL
uniref:Uncharacterized protein n=1 Tax=Solanum lycopersicum TaxID=4081 RepID=A0A3Q7JBW5_SOLLC